MQCQGISGGYKGGPFGKSRSASRAESMMFLHRYADEAHSESATQTFRDVPVTSGGFTAIDWAVSHKITTGYADGSFGYTRPVTRGEFSTFMYRWLRPEIPVPAGAPFGDVPATSTHAKAITWMTDLGILSGYQDGTFRPNRAISRAEMATIMHRVDGKIDPHEVHQPFIDPTTPQNRPHAGRLLIE